MKSALHLRSYAWLIALLSLARNERMFAQTQHINEQGPISGLLPSAARRLQAVDSNTCYDRDTTAATVNSTLQLHAEQQLQNQTVQQEVLSGLSQYLRVPECNIQLTYNTSTVCPVVSAANNNDACTDGNYICRGVTQVPQNIYSAVQDNECTADASSSTATCLGTSLDLTTYLSIQQGQCCLQCPGQTACTTDASAISTQTTPVSFECGNLTLSIAVGDSLDGSSLEELLGVAVSGGLLDLYLQSSGLPDSSALSVGPTGETQGFFACLVLHRKCISDAAVAGFQSIDDILYLMHVLIYTQVPAVCPIASCSSTLPLCDMFPGNTSLFPIPYCLHCCCYTLYSWQVPQRLCLLQAHNKHYIRCVARLGV